TLAGLEIEEILRSGRDLSALRVGHVVEREQHPNADRLSYCQVDLGDGEPVGIVCGAPNVRAGLKVAVAAPGTVLPDGTKLKKSKIRGVTSLGMICSERELGLSQEHEGILVLPEDAPVGAPVTDVLDAGDTVLEVAIMPNRGDCASLLGVARELRAHYGGQVTLPACEVEEGRAAAAERVSVSIEDAAGCHHYVARVVTGLSVGPSPDWLQEKLAAVGVRSINCVVDATNLVLAELGQPLHAFDLEAVANGEVRVRSAAAGETLETLDGQVRELQAADLVIADAERPIALAGVMGGAHSEVRDGTTAILIESAHFAPGRIRHTGRRLGLFTDASYRFERGVDPEGVARAADRAARLIAELAGGTVLAGRVEARGDACPRSERVVVSVAHVNRLLGTELDSGTMREVLARLDIACQETDEGLVCTPPSHRHDLWRPQDLIEEIARIHGYDRIPATLPKAAMVRPGKPASWGHVAAVGDTLRAEGVTEVLCFPFLDPSDLDALELPEDDARRHTLGVKNPIIEREGRLRTTLAPSLLRRLRDNHNRQVDSVRLFEVARVFEAQKTGELPREILRAGVVLGRGQDFQLWETRERPPLFFEAKGVALRVLASLGLEGRVVGGAEEPFLHPGASASLQVGREPVGVLGELHPEIATRFEVPESTAWIDLDLSKISGLPRQESRYSEVSKHPRVRRDLAVVMDRDQPAAAVLDAIRKQAGSNLVNVELFDCYEGKGVPEGRRSLAFRLVFQRTDRTLTDAEVTKATDRVVQMLAHRFGGELR
ncbi:MAG: phenylalanine--tRNA ligase subunit beta, partial [Proteobacteria bacterium]|nr:phenylalanine--tRNA ligase subunit beta [Pseudomonadota bacterium]